MTVRVNKSAFNIREKLSELERPIGIKGHELMGAETAQDARDLVSAGRKNALYNGDMQIWQRGTTFANGGGGAAVNYTADRWNSTRYASSENDVTREDANHLGFRYCLRSARGGGDTTTTARFVSQVLEQKDTWKLRGKYVTFSFYLRVGSGFNGGLVKSSITYHTDSAREERFNYNQFQNGNNTQSRIEHKSVSTDWQRFTHTTYIPDNAQQVGVSIESDENLPNAVSADYFEMTGCQLEVGRNATEFEHRPYTEEFVLCKRYYQRWNGNDPDFNAYDSGANRSATTSVARATMIAHGHVHDPDDANVSMMLDVEMRDNPTVELPSGNNSIRIMVGPAIYDNASYVQENNCSRNILSVFVDNGGTMTASQPASLILRDANSYLALDAEL